MLYVISDLMSQMSQMPDVIQYVMSDFIPDVMPDFMSNVLPYVMPIAMPIMSCQRSEVMPLII